MQSTSVHRVHHSVPVATPSGTSFSACSWSGPPVVHMRKGLVAHEEGAHDLEGRDLQWEVEGSDERHWAKWPPVAVALLPCMVA